MSKYGKDREERVTYENPVHYSIAEWKNWSLTPHTPEEIRNKILDDFDNVCFSFVCSASKIPEEFYPEFMALSTGLITRENYDKYIDNVTKAVLMNAGIIEKDTAIMKWGIPIECNDCQGKSKTRIIKGAEMTDRIDWYAVTVHQKLTEDFMRRYKKCIVWNMVPHHQKITTAFYAEMHDKIPLKVVVKATKVDRDDATENSIANYFKNLQKSSVE